MLGIYDPQLHWQPLVASVSQAAFMAVATLLHALRFVTKTILRSLFRSPAACTFTNA